MTFRTSLTVGSIGIALAAGLSLVGSPAHMQEDPLGGRARAMVTDRGPSGIDRGLRDLDPPREPRRTGMARQRANGSVASRSYLSGSIIVKFREGTAQPAMLSAMRAVNGGMKPRLSYADFDIVTIAADADVEAAAAELRTHDDVEYAQPRYFNHPTLRPNDALYNLQWNFPAIDMERAWDIQPQAGSEIIVAVLDTGVAMATTTLRYNSRFSFRATPNGPLLPPLGIVDIPFAVAPELGSAKFVAARDFIWDDGLPPVDLDSHGTHVSGTVGQLTNNGTGVAGMAYNVRIMPVKVIIGLWDDVFDSPNFGTDDDVARGVRYAVDNGAKVINMSLGRTEGGPATVLDDAIRYAVSRGAFVAVAAGNEADVGNAPNRAAQSAPNINGMVAVGAVGRALDRAYYSNTNVYVELVAPGGDQRRDGTPGGILQQTLDLDQLETFFLGPQRFRAPRADVFNYYFFQGTSMATPHVAALAAMLMQQGITSPAAVEAAMKQFARDLGRPGVDTEFGSGLIQPRETLRGLGLAR